MRLFTAIDISAEVRENLRAFVARLKPLAKLTWSPVENLHITTKFIGEWPEKRLDEMKHALAKVRAGGAIEISIQGIGWFPDQRRPRVFWAGVEASDALRSLAAATDTATTALGVPRENRSYSPHLTLARVREPIRLEKLQDALAEMGGASADARFVDKDAPGLASGLASESASPADAGATVRDRGPAFQFGTFRATAFFLYLSAAGRYTKLSEFPSYLGS
jgi:RNA 2',3'-cyclic 3'-phosphodiesterase